MTDDEARTTRATPAVDRLMALMRKWGPVGCPWMHWYQLQDTLWVDHRMSCDSAQRALRQAERRGLMFIKRRNPARSDTWDVRLAHEEDDAS